MCLNDGIGVLSVQFDGGDYCYWIFFWEMFIKFGCYQYIVDVNIGIGGQMFKLKIVSIVVIGGNYVDVIVQYLNWQCMSCIVNQ